MMKLTLVLSLLFAGILAQAAQLNWSDVEAGHKYILTTDIKINETITLKKGDAFEYQDLLSGEVPVLYLTFKNLQCTDPSLKTDDTVLVNPAPEDHSTDRSVGVLLDSDCVVGIYVEPKDYYYPSLFEDAK
ncbi:MAG: hypothetical protein ACXVAX_09620 [Pseudobdellovibrio sp.]